MERVFLRRFGALHLYYFDSTFQCGAGVRSAHTLAYGERRCGFGVCFSRYLKLLLPRAACIASMIYHDLYEFFADTLYSRSA